MAEYSARIQEICDRALQNVYRHVDDFKEPGKKNFTDACLNHAKESYGLAPDKQCFFAHKGNHFITNKYGKQIPTSERSAGACIVRMAQKEKWWEPPVKKAGAKEAGKDAEGPGGEKGEVAEEPKTIDHPPDVARPPEGAAVTGMELKSNWSVQVGAAWNTSNTGLSVNNAAPMETYAGNGNGFVKVGRFVAPVSLGGRWAYTTLVDVQADYAELSSVRAHSNSPKISVWGVGPTASTLFVHEFGGGGSRLVIGSVFAFLVGALSTDGCVDVGIPGACYRATRQRMAGTFKAGVTAGFETPSENGQASLVLLVYSGLRYVLHADQVTDTPAGYEGAMVRLNGVTFDAFGMSVGLNFQ